MNNDILKPKEENLFSLAAELGLVVFSTELPTSDEQKNITENQSNTPKPFCQLT